MREMWDAAQGGDLDRAREIDEGLRPLYEALRHHQPDPVKAALGMPGLIPSGRLRLPLVAADAEQRATVRAALEGVGVPATLRNPYERR